MQPEGRALIVAAEREAPEAGLLLAVAAVVLDRLARAPERDDQLERRVEVVDPEEEVRAGARIAAVDPPGDAPAGDHEAAAHLLEAPAEQPAVEGSRPRHLADADAEEAHLARHRPLPARRLWGGR